MTRRRQPPAASAARVVTRPPRALLDRRGQGSDTVTIQVRDVVCKDCGARVPSFDGDSCPLCRGPVEVDDDMSPDALTLRLRFTVSDCDACQFVITSTEATVCPNCSVPVSLEPDAHVSLRTQMYGPGLDRLVARAAALQQLTFERRGSRMAAEVYPGWTSQAIFKPIGAVLPGLRAIIATTLWDDVADATTVVAWDLAQSKCNEAIDLAITIIKTPPPILFLTLHRRSAATAREVAIAAVTYLSCLVAPDPVSAMNRMRNLEASLSDVAEAIGRTDVLLNYVSPVLIDKSAPRSIVEQGVIQLVDAFPEVARQFSHDQSVLRPLAPLSFASTVLQDGARRGRRFDEARSLLVAASQFDPNWIEDQDLFVERFVAGWRQLRSQTERITDSLAPEPDPYLAHTALDVFSKILEGPYKRFGAILTIAITAATGGARYNDETAFAANSVSVVTRALMAAAPSIMQDINSVLRNAEAHHDYEVGPLTIRIRHTAPRHKSFSEAIHDEVSLDDIVEEALNLVETSQAMLLAVLAAILARPPSPITEHLRLRWLNT